MTAYSTKNKFPPNAYFWLFRFFYTSLPRVVTLFLQLRTGLEKVVLKLMHYAEANKQLCLTLLLVLLPGTLSYTGAILIYFV